MTKFRPGTASIRSTIKKAQKKRMSAFESTENVALAKIFEVDGSHKIQTRPGYVWIHEWGMPESPASALAGSVSVKAGDWVKVKRDPKNPYEWQIYDMWSGGLTPGNYSLIIRHMVALHGQNHQMPTEASLGVDPTKVYRPAMQELKCTGDGTTLTITVQAHTYIYEGVRKEFSGGLVDLTSSVPAASMKRRTLVYLSESTNALSIVDGTEVLSAGSTPAPNPILPSNGRASAIVELVNGQTSIVTADDVLDTRDWLAGGSSSGSFLPSASGLGQILIYDSDGPVWGKPLIDDDDFSIVIDDDDFSIVYDG